MNIQEKIAASDPQIDLDMARASLTALAGPGASFTFQCFFDPKRNGRAFHCHGTFDQCRDRLVRANKDKLGVFVAVNETDGKGRTKENIVALRGLLFVDCDAPDQVDRVERGIEARGLTPKLVVNSSDGKKHFYWNAPDVSLDEFEAMQKALIALWQTDASIKGRERVMRLPGFLHQKDPANPQLVTFDRPASPCPDIVAALKLREFEGASKAKVKGEPKPSADAPAQLARLASALAVIPLAEESVWTDVAMAIAHYAAIHSDEAEAIYSILDDASKKFKGYDPDENRKRFGRYCEKALDHVNPLTIKSVFKMAWDHGWRPPADADEWPDLTQKGIPKATARNCMVAIERLGIEVKGNAFSGRTTVGGMIGQSYVGTISDETISILQNLVSETFPFDATPATMAEAVDRLAVKNSHHPVRAMLEALPPWDGVGRIARLFIDYMGAADAELMREFGRIFATAAVARIIDPGCKYDQLIVLEGAQGTGKSTAVRILAMEDEWFSDAPFISLDAKEQMEVLQGRWIFEIAELDGIHKAEAGRLKHAISKQVDSGRPAYGRYREDRPRQCVLIGTTNDEQYLLDPTGNRRFWPVKTGKIRLDEIERDREQIWAEALVAYRKNPDLRLPEHLWAAAADEQEERETEDPLIDNLSTIVGRTEGGVEKITTREIFAHLKTETAHQNIGMTRRIAAGMRKHGWETKRIRDGAAVVRGYERPAPAARADGEWM